MRGEGFGAMIITHYQRLLNYIKPDVVHIMMDGRIVMTGDADLAARLEKEGYAHLLYIFLSKCGFIMMLIYNLVLILL